MEFNLDNSKMHQLFILLSLIISQNQLKIKKEEISFQKKNIIIKNLITQAIQFKSYEKFLPIQTIYQGFLQIINNNCITTNEYINIPSKEIINQQLVKKWIINQLSFSKSQLTVNQIELPKKRKDHKQQLNAQYLFKILLNRIENYLIQKQIGQGSYGIVKVGINLLNGQQVAIKIYERMNIIQKKEYIRKEIQILSTLQHPNIVQLLDVIQTETQVQLVMEYAGPLSLRAYLKQQPNNLIPEIQEKNIFLQVVKAIDYCQSKNIINRDIKSENILFRDNKIKLIDFGFSSFIEHKTISYFGTPSQSLSQNYQIYGPEIILKMDYGKPADIWSLGLLLYVMFHGKFPFQGKQQKELFSKIKTGIYQFNGITQQAQKLINNMLRVRSYERCNIKEIIKDQWFQQWFYKIFDSVNIVFKQWHQPSIILTNNYIEFKNQLISYYRINIFRYS
ncbi:unnamed protein product [Paramecium pentaurelia]|uniref:Protein kinase domain-containing protein n=1 Tax=Paramecium pentaurelia TaxID=43138 RepID=A0A8S1X8Z0_9CILI|nr:unnamed protein product [Paramecium pentaurelia]